MGSGLCSQKSLKHKVSHRVLVGESDDEGWRNHADTQSESSAAGSEYTFNFLRDHDAADHTADGESSEGEASQTTQLNNTAGTLSGTVCSLPFWDRGYNPRHHQLQQFPVDMVRSHHRQISIMMLIV